MIFGLIKKPNTNEETSSILSSRMKSSGLSFAHISQCFDSNESLKPCVLAALSRCDVVIVIMPLRPKTQARSIVADALNVPMEYSRRALKHLQAYFDGDIGKAEEFSDCAWLPSGSRVLLGDSPIPACACLKDEKAVFLIDEEYDAKVMDSLIAFCLSIASPVLTSNAFDDHNEVATPVGVQAAFVAQNAAKTSDMSSKPPSGASLPPDGIPENNEQLSNKRRFPSPQTAVFLILLCAILLAGTSIYIFLPRILATFDSDNTFSSLSHAGTVLPSALNPVPSQESFAVTGSNQDTSESKQPSFEALSQAPPTNSTSQSASIASSSSSQAATATTSSLPSSAAPPAASKPEQDNQTEVIEIDSPFITDDRTSQSTPPPPTSSAASSSEPASFVKESSQAPVSRPPEGKADELLSFIANGRRQTMEAFDLVCAIVQNETNGILDTEALKAQAVASYTYLLHHNAAGTSPSVGIKTTVNENVRSAVSAVFGQTIRYNGNYINATYHSTSSGKTTSAESVWGADIPYLISVDSSLDRQAPKFQHTVQIDADRFAELVLKVYGIELDGSPNDWIVAKRDAPGGYVGTVTLGGFTSSQGGSYGSGRTITGRSIRESLMSFSIRSHCFVVQYADDRDAFLFTTYGYGHGVGMSQYGAHFMSLEGNTYLDILRHYYPGTSIS